MSTEDGIGKPALVQVAELFQRHGVEFIVLGGQAAALFGSPIPTYDIDLCYRRTEENLRRLADALHELHPTLRGAPEDLPFRIDAESLALGSNFTLNTDLAPLHLIGCLEPVGTYDDLLPGAEQFDLDGLKVQVIGLIDLLTIKRHLARPKDRAMLALLEAIERLRESGE